ncbi:MAG: hypothetical protein ACRDGQ_07970 [Candidatus Limnocylindrales bacterium]
MAVATATGLDGAGDGDGAADGALDAPDATGADDAEPDNGGGTFEPHAARHVASTTVTRILRIITTSGG